MPGWQDKTASVGRKGRRLGREVGRAASTGGAKLHNTSLVEPDSDLRRPSGDQAGDQAETSLRETEPETRWDNSMHVSSVGGGRVPQGNSGGALRHGRTSSSAERLSASLVRQGDRPSHLVSPSPVVASSPIVSLFPSGGAFGRPWNGSGVNGVSPVKMRVMTLEIGQSNGSNDPLRGNERRLAEQWLRPGGAGRREETSRRQKD